MKSVRNRSRGDSSGDGSGASYFWALAALTGGKVLVENLRTNAPRPDLEFVDVLSRMSGGNFEAS